MMWHILLVPFIGYLLACVFTRFLSATEYHSDADYNSRRVGVVVVVVVVVVIVIVVIILKNG